MSRWIVGIAVAAALAGGLPAAALEYYVAPGGNDDNPGTKADPFATLERARDAVRAARAGEGEQLGPVTVHLREGWHSRRETFALTSEDSGRANAPIVYRAHEEEAVHLTGGKAVTGFEPVTDPAILERLPVTGHGKVLQADLKTQDVTDFGEMRMRGFAQPIVPAPLELFYDDKPMTLARWPNTGFVMTGPVSNPGSIPRDDDKGNEGGTFVYKEEEPSKWTSAEDVWMFGYWCWDWADECIRVGSIDTEKKEVKLDAPHHYGLKEGKRYYAFNLLEELDNPSEWYLDRKTGILYFWPPGPIQNGEVWVSLLKGPMVAARGVNHVTFQGLTFECVRGTIMHMVGGAHNRVAGCTFRNAGNLGIVLGVGAAEGEVVGLLGCSVHSRGYQDTAWNRNAGVGHRIDGCTLYNLGEGGIILGGGDRIALAHGDNAVLNCEIHNYSRSVTTNRPAIWIDGAGNRVQHNHIHDAPHTGIMFWGNDHLIEFNEIDAICKETGDVGAIYTGRDWTMRGNVLRYNYIHNVHGPGLHGAQAIYLDDQASGTLCFGNVIVDVSRAFLIGGGRDNVVENNVMVQCDQSVYIDARGTGWTNDNAGTIGKRLGVVPYKEDAWRARYPKLAEILEDEPGLPKGNAVRNNVLFKSGALDIDERAKEHGTIENNVAFEEDPGFVDPAKGGYQLREDAPAFKRVPGFEGIPFDKIGPQKKPAEPEPKDEPTEPA